MEARLRLAEAGFAVAVAAAAATAPPAPAAEVFRNTNPPLDRFLDAFGGFFMPPTPPDAVDAFRFTSFPNVRLRRLTVAIINKYASKR